MLLLQVAVHHCDALDASRALPRTPSPPGLRAYVPGALREGGEAVLDASRGRLRTARAGHGLQQLALRATSRKAAEGHVIVFRYT